MKPLLSILIASVPERAEMLDALAHELERQCALHDHQAAVMIDTRPLPVGRKRTELIAIAAGEYVCFVDDDDHVALDYVARIMEALEPRVWLDTARLSRLSEPSPADLIFDDYRETSRPDYVGFKVRYSVDGIDQKPVIHSTIRCDGWSETPDAYLRDISHLNPIRRSIALEGLPFQDGFGEDATWADRIRASCLVRREVFIDQELYHYDYRSAGSMFSARRASQFEAAR